MQNDEYKALLTKFRDLVDELNVVKSDLEFRRELFKLQEQNLNQLSEALSELRKQRDDAMEIANRVVDILKNR